MKTFKKKLKKFGKLIWEFFKNSLPASLMFCTAGIVLMMLTMKGGSDALEETVKHTWTSTSLLWTIVCAVAACGYEGLLMYAYGGTHYEMLVSGNLKRTSELGYRDSKHKEEKEYRAWKGFAVGAFVALFTIVFGIIFGCNQKALSADTAENLSTGMAILLLVGFFLSGWSIIPLYLMNATGIYVSYFWSCLFGILPIIVAGVFYIIGAYGRRNKVIRQQELADKAAATATQKPKKINYGGLPGTKPKKRK